MDQPVHPGIDLASWIQAVAALVSCVVACMVLYWAYRQARAADKQAEYAQQQADLARESLEELRREHRDSLAPILILEGQPPAGDWYHVTLHDNGIADEQGTPLFYVRNFGHGVAQEVVIRFWNYLGSYEACMGLVGPQSASPVPRFQTHNDIRDPKALTPVSPEYLQSTLFEIICKDVSGRLNRTYGRWDPQSNRWVDVMFDNQGVPENISNILEWTKFRNPYMKPLPR